MAAYRNNMPINLPISEVDKEPPEAPNVLVDAVSLVGSSDSKQKPLVRHVLVKDLNKIGTRLKLEHPKTGVFRNKAPMGLYALFDGQSGAGIPGPMAAEFCARNFHTKLLERLSKLTEATADRACVEAALRLSFEDLDRELLAAQPPINDGCGAAVALLIGDHVFAALLGRCRAVLSECEEGSQCTPLALGGGQRQLDEDQRRLTMTGGSVVGTGSSARIGHPSGALSPVSRSLGDRSWKGSKGGGSGLPILVCTPEVHSVVLRVPDEHPCLLLVASSVASALNPQELVNVAGEFQVQPRAACGEIASRALDARAGSAALAHCTALQVCFLPHRPGFEDRKRALGAAGPEPPPQAKKARTVAARGGGTQSVRLRHILLRCADGQQPVNDADARSKKPTRNRQEAEAMLRRFMNELRNEVRACKKAPKDATELVNIMSKKFTELCKEHSECETARKGGNMCGDLGWVTTEERAKLGASFKEVVDVLLPGQLSDIAVSETGLHLVQRVA
eukprot:TRINITY_DN19877_c0_g1_i1.p1 TRINITY_DN19877_c0_g1~~TRINITY_DN19877_c0_g1_i1.p1  ORF type:complete len:554 (+),score=100.03 TRINITY_DN19877_c0_g1_i1:143-1663(+)